MEIKTPVKIAIGALIIFLIFRFFLNEKPRKNDDGNSDKHPTDPLPEDQGQQPSQPKAKDESENWQPTRNTLKKSELISETFKGK